MNIIALVYSTGNGLNIVNPEHQHSTFPSANGAEHEIRKSICHLSGNEEKAESVGSVYLVLSETSKSTDRWIQSSLLCPPRLPSTAITNPAPPPPARCHFISHLRLPITLAHGHLIGHPADSLIVQHNILKAMLNTFLFLSFCRIFCALCFVLISHRSYTPSSGFFDGRDWAIHANFFHEGKKRGRKKDDYCIEPKTGHCFFLSRVRR